MRQISRNLAYGIDFGTTNSSVAVTCGGETKVLETDNIAPDPEITRSVIYASPKRDFLIGEAAVKAYLADVAQGPAKEKKFIYTGKFIKVTKPFSLVSGYQGEMSVPDIIEVEEGSGGRLFQSLKTGLASKLLSKFDVFGADFTIEDLLGIFLKVLKEAADRELGQKVEKVVLGRPVHFVGNNDEAAQAKLKKAAQNAGFKEIAFELEPVAAALSYGVEVKENQTAMIFDFGGGTLDISIVWFPEGKILASVGAAIGGDLINSEIFETKLASRFGSNLTFGDQSLPLPSYIFGYLKDWYQISLLKTRSFSASTEHMLYKCSDPIALKALESLVTNNLGFSLYEEIDKAKKALSNQPDASILMKAKSIDINQSLTRPEFEDIVRKNLLDIKILINDALSQSNLDESKIDVVVTTGGSSLIPVVREQLGNQFGADKIKTYKTFTSVAAGLSLRAEQIFCQQNR